MIAGLCALVNTPGFICERTSLQLLQCGLLVEVEGLLSCHGDELGMLEDMLVAIDDLRFVRFSFTSSGSEPIILKGG